MPEAGGANIEVAHHLNEHHGSESAHGNPRVHSIVEVVEALVLALVAITTAWSGYQSARWDSVQSELYGQSTRLRVEGQALEVEANQLKQYDAATVVEWIKAEAHGETKLAELFERRLFPEFRPAFEAWKKTDPLRTRTRRQGLSSCLVSMTSGRRRPRRKTRTLVTYSSGVPAHANAPTNTCG